MKSFPFSILMRCAVSLLISQIFIARSYAQQHLELSAYSNETEISAPLSVTLKPGFYIPSGKTVRIYTSLSSTPFAGQPSPTQNYLSTLTFRKETTDGSTAGLKINDVNQTVQYFDGHGRPLQIVQTQGSPTARDMVTPIVYDAYGREEKKYLPYVATASVSNGSYKALALTDQTSFYLNPTNATWQAPGVVSIPSDAAFSKTIFEESPLNRVLEQGATGMTWQPAASRTTTSGRTVVMDYGSNNSSTSYATTGLAVRLYQANAVVTTEHTHERTLAGTGFYEANQLYLNISKDENWTEVDGKLGTIEEYKDKEDRVVLKRTFNKVGTTIQTLSTYYVYDDLGNLSFVLPPGANPDATALPSQTLLNGTCYQYRYDGRKRLIEKKVPGKGWEFMIYNQLDQVTMTQDANQRSKTTQDWTVSKYDIFGRIVITGIYSHVNSTAGTSYRTMIQTSVDNEIYYWENQTTNGSGYTLNRTYPAIAETSLLSVNYYDDYAIPGVPNNQSANYTSMTRTLLTASKIKVLGSAGFLWRVNYYDDKARLVKYWQQHYKGGTMVANNYDEVSSTYSFTNELTASTRRHYVAGVEKLYVANRYIYDHVGRKVDTYQKTGDNVSTGNPEVLLSKSVYNELGQLKEKKLHRANQESTFAQTVQYGYNERGWLSSQVAPLFSQRLRYQEPVMGVTPQYNGNISRQEWGTGKYYNYTYDKLHRLTNAVGSPGNHESIGYDVMGNITRMKRWLNGTVQDQMRYNYTTSTNHLASVIDTNASIADPRFQLAGTTSYSYDDNGNMKSRTNAANVGNNISAIAYNHLNLPKTLTAGGMALTYIYDAAGNKLRKYSTSINNEYISGVHYENGSLAFLQTETGRAIRNGSGTDPEYLYEYTLADYLGNGRMYFGISGGGATKIQETDYYAFGLAIQASAVVGTENLYQYNGKEQQQQEKMYDYGARFYDPVIGRWNVVDPIAENYASLSPYIYVANNPINAIDPDGRKIIFVNGLIAFGAPPAGEKYWGGRSGGFVKGAQNYFDDNTVDFIAYNPSRFSSVKGRKEDGRSYALENLHELTAGLKDGEQFEFVTHSMGAAYAEGIMEVLREKGYIVGQAVHINAFQAADIDVSDKQVAKGTGVATFTYDFQNTDDPVINNSFRSSPGRIKGADRLIRSKSPNGRPLTNIHAGPIWDGKKTWDFIDSYRTSFDVYEWIKEMSNQNPNITVTIN